MYGVSNSLNISEDMRQLAFSRKKTRWKICSTNSLGIWELKKKKACDGLVD